MRFQGSVERARPGRRSMRVAEGARGIRGKTRTTMERARIPALAGRATEEYRSEFPSPGGTSVFSPLFPERQSEPPPRALLYRVGSFGL